VKTILLTLFLIYIASVIIDLIENTWIEVVLCVGFFVFVIALIPLFTGQVSKEEFQRITGFSNNYRYDIRYCCGDAEKVLQIVPIFKEWE